MAGISLDGKVAIVTGGASGMGLVMARALLDAGAKIAAVDQNADGLAAFVRAAAQAGAADRLLTIRMDVTDAKACGDMVAKTRDRFGGLHALVNNAGLGMQHVIPESATRRAKFWEAPPDRWLRLLTVNAMGPFLTARSVLPHLLAQKQGRIVNVTTSLDTMLARGFSPYGPAKACLEAQSAVWAKDLAGTGVTCNILVPGGATDTPFVTDRPGLDRAQLIKAEVMAAPIVWLVSDEAAEINGSRFVARLWDPALPPREAAKRVRAAIGWEGFGIQGVRPDLDR